MFKAKTHKPFVIAARIVASWVLAIVVLLGGLYTVQSHGGVFGSAPIANAYSGGYWVKLTGANGGLPVYVNLAASSSVLKGTMDNKPATLVWSGGAASAVTESPEEILTLPPIKMAR